MIGRKFEGENKRDGGGGKGGGVRDRNRCVVNHNGPVPLPKRSVMIHNARRFVVLQFFAAINSQKTPNLVTLFL